MVTELNACLSDGDQFFFFQTWKYMILKKKVGFIFGLFFSHLGFVFLVAHLQPLHKTLGQLQWLKLG